MQANRLVMQGTNRAATSATRAAVRVTGSHVEATPRTAQITPVALEQGLEVRGNMAIPSPVMPIETVSTPTMDSPVVSVQKVSEIEWTAHERVLPDLKFILPHCPDFSALLTIQTWQRTEHSMVSWKSAVEEEREEKTAKVVSDTCCSNL